MNYQTEVLDLKTEYDAALSKAARLIQSGEVVVFPTETVYGLGADAFNESAVKKIFEAKGRPADNPLIVHIDAPDKLYALSCRVPQKALQLASAFWPGPLTLVLKKDACVSDLVTAGLDSVAIRMPKEKSALELIAQSRTCIAAPSANLSGRPSPTTAAHALSDMKGRVRLILDGGPCSVGVESTVLDVSKETATLLRPGGITLEMLRDCIGSVEVSPGVLTPFEGKALSPGMKYRHYAPKARVVLVDGENTARAICRLYDEYTKDGLRCAIAATTENAPLYGARMHSVCGTRKDPSTIAHSFFALLRDFDASGRGRHISGNAAQ